LFKLDLKNAKKQFFPLFLPFWPRCRSERKFLIRFSEILDNLASGLKISEWGIHIGQKSLTTQINNIIWLIHFFSFTFGRLTLFLWKIFWNLVKWIHFTPHNWLDLINYLRKNSLTLFVFMVSKIHSELARIKIAKVIIIVKILIAGKIM
jgi:hypothetical protein